MYIHTTTINNKINIIINTKPIFKFLKCFLVSLSYLYSIEHTYHVHYSITHVSLVVQNRYRYYTYMYSTCTIIHTCSRALIFIQSCVNNCRPSGDSAGETSRNENYELHGKGWANVAPVAQTLQSVRQTCPCTIATLLYTFLRFKKSSLLHIHMSHVDVRITTTVPYWVHYFIFYPAEPGCITFLLIFFLVGFSSYRSSCFIVAPIDSYSHRRPSFHRTSNLLHSILCNALQYSGRWWWWCF